MSSSANALIQVETGRSLVAYAAMTNSGDNTVFTPANATLSGFEGSTPVVRPNGVVTGANLVSAAASLANNAVDVAAFTAYSIAVLQTVSASVDKTITRPATAVSKVNSITMTSAGAIAVVAGTDGATTAFSEVRGAAGGPPYIPVDSVELAQVRVTSNTAAPIVASEIFQTVGQHSERSDYPVYTLNNIGLGSYSATAGKVSAHVAYDVALPLAHTGDTAKRTYIQYYTPTMSSLARALDFVPVENTTSVSSTQFYNGSIGSKSTSLGQGGFTALLDDGVNDALVQNKDKTLTVKFFPDRNKPAYIMTQGTLSLSRTFPVANQNQATVSISSEVTSAEFTS